MDSHRNRKLSVRCHAGGVRTHEVLNQATPLSGHDAATADVALMDGVRAFGGDWGLADLVVVGIAAPATPK